MIVYGSQPTHSSAVAKLVKHAYVGRALAVCKTSKPTPWSLLRQEPYNPIETLRAS
jgi:hypothetical protein